MNRQKIDAKPLILLRERRGAAPSFSPIQAPFLKYSLHFSQIRYEAHCHSLCLSVQLIADPTNAYVTVSIKKQIRERRCRILPCA